MTRRLIWVVAAVAVIGGLGLVAYDRYLGSELRQGRELRDALAAELADAGIAFTSMKYDWRARRVVAKDLVATKLPEGVAIFTIGEVVYRGEDPSAIRAAFADTAAKGEPRELVTDLSLSKILIGFENGAEFKQESLNIKQLGLGEAVSRDTGQGREGPRSDGALLQAADVARRLHVRLLKAEGTHFWHPEAQATYEQKLLRLEDYRAGNFSEFRMEGMNLSVAVVARARLDEFFIESVKARRFLDSFHKSPVYALSSDFRQAFAEMLENDESVASEKSAPERLYPSAAESAIKIGDTAFIGFEALIPAMGRVAFEEVSTSNRQYLNGVELGWQSKVVALELQFNMLAQMLTAGLDALGVDLATAAADAGSEAEAWLAGRAGNQARGEVPVTASLQADGDTPADESGRPDPAKETESTHGAGTGHGAADRRAETKDNEQIPMGPHAGEVEQGPAAPTPKVWGNEIEPPPAVNNRELAEFIRRLGFDNLRIDSESVALFDQQGGVWEMSKYGFDMQNFWTLGFNIRFSGLAALEQLGHVPVGMGGWWQGHEADALGERILKEGRFDGLSFTYRDQGFVPRLMALIAEKQETTVEAVATAFVTELFADEEEVPMLQAEGLPEAIKAFLISPEVFSIRFAPAAPVPLGPLTATETQKTSFPEIADGLGMVLTFNGKSFENFKKSAPIGSDIKSEED